MVRRAHWLLVAGILTRAAWSAPEPVASAADYYFARHDFTQAFALWTEAQRLHPDSLSALLRLSELRLMFDGRPAVTRGIVGYLKSHAGLLSRETRRHLREKLATLQSVFLTDEGQTTFLQGRAYVRRNDCVGALNFFNQSAALEKGNVRVLREKAHCERRTGMFDRYYATLKQAAESDPFDAGVGDSLAEAHLYYQEYGKVLETVRADSDGFPSRRLRTAQAIALLRSGAVAPAIGLLQGLADERGASAHPAVLWELGRHFAGKPDRHAQGLDYLRRFLRATAKVDASGWDPYGLQERRTEARKLLTAASR